MQLVLQVSEHCGSFWVGNERLDDRADAQCIVADANLPRWVEEQPFGETFAVRERPRCGVLASNAGFDAVFPHSECVRRGSLTYRDPELAQVVHR